MIDGEIVALGRSGAWHVVQDFERLGPIFSRPGPHQPSADDPALNYVAYDLLELAGENLRRKPWSERRALFDELIPGRREHVGTAVEAASAEAHARHLLCGFEGSVAKERGGRYLGGKSRWLRIKARHRARAIAGAVSARRDGELRILCRGAEPEQASPAGALTPAISSESGWAEVWAPELRERLRAGRDELVGSEIDVVYSGVTARGRLREARVVALG